MPIKTCINPSFSVSNRRRPKPRKAELVRNPIFAEDECYSISECDDCLHLTPSPKPKTVMQKVSDWIGRLGNRNKKSRRNDPGVKPQIVVGTFCPQPFNNMDHCYNNYINTNTQLKRRAICTNPWFILPDTSRSMITTSLSGNNELLDTSYSSSLSHLTRDESLCINTLGGSACSSGYGSNDNRFKELVYGLSSVFVFSPECSVHQPHWQPSTQIENRGSLVDKAVECHSLDLDEAMDDDEGDSTYNRIYYELEPTLTQIKDAYADDSCYSGSVGLNTNMSSISSRADSPIYAVPCSSAGGESRCGSIEYVDDSDGYAELVRRCQPEPPLKNPPIIDHNANGYAKLRRSTDRTSAFTRCVPRLPSPKFFAPPPPPLNEFPRTCLDLLDEQIAELKVTRALLNSLTCEHLDEDRGRQQTSRNSQRASRTPQLCEKPLPGAY